MSDYEEQIQHSVVESQFDTNQPLDVGSIDGQSIFAGIARWIFYVVVFLTPLWFLPYTFDVVEFNKIVLLSIGASLVLVLYLLDAIKRGGLEFRRTKLNLPIALFLIASFAALMFSVDTYGSLFGIGAQRAMSFVGVMSYAIIFFVGLNLLTKGMTGLKLALMASLTIAFLTAFLQVIDASIFTGIYDSVTFNTLGGINILGVLAAISLPIFMLRISHGGGVLSVVEKIMRWLGLLLALYFLLLLNSWIFWTGAFVSSMLYGLFNSLNSGEKSKIKTFIVPMVIVVVGTFFLVIQSSPFEGTRDKLVFESTPGAGESLNIAWGAVSDRPLGWGQENFGLAYDKFKPAERANSVDFQTRFLNSSSEVISMVVEGGVLVLLAGLFLLYRLITSLYVAYQNRFFDNEDSPKAAAALIAGVVLLFLIPVNIVFWLLLALLLVLVFSDEKGAEEKRVLDYESSSKYAFIGSIVFVLSLVLALMNGFFLYRNYDSGVHLRNASEGGDSNYVINELVDARNSNARDTRIQRLLSQATVAKLNEAIQAGPNQGESQDEYNNRILNLIDSSVNFAQQATQFTPYDSQTWLNGGFIYENLILLNVPGAHQAAANMYQESIERNPLQPAAYYRRGNMYLTAADNLEQRNGNGDDIAALLSSAETDLLKAIDLFNNYGQAHYRLAAVYERQGRLDEAIAQFQRLIPSNPRNPALPFQLGLLYVRKDDLPRAQAQWEQAVVIFPEYSNARWYLSFVYENNGELNKALDEILKIEALNPNNELVIQRKNQLEANQRIIPPGTVLEQEPLN